MRISDEQVAYLEKLYSSEDNHEEWKKHYDGRRGSQISDILADLREARAEVEKWKNYNAPAVRLIGEAGERAEKAEVAHQAAYNALSQIEKLALRLQIATGRGEAGDIAEIARRTCDASEKAYEGLQPAVDPAVCRACGARARVNTVANGSECYACRDARIAREGAARWR